MKTKFFVATLAFAFFGIAGTQAQTKSEHSGHDHAKMEKAEAKTAYACSMKCEGDKTYDEAGSCPKCGMNLTAQKADSKKMAKAYTCSMHPEVSSEKGGSCPKCGMALVEKKMDMKMDKKKDDGHGHSGHGH